MELERLIAPITFLNIGVLPLVHLNINEVKVILKNEHSTNLSIFDIMSVANIKMLQYIFVDMIPNPKV